jgi:vacuolar-type H+-ATPase catalytic subunit A/Vma1
METNAHADFLRRQAVALRDLALRSPRIAEALRRLAGQLDEMAEEVDGKPRSPGDGHDDGP